jgi:hypothetical protein
MSKSSSDTRRNNLETLFWLETEFVRVPLLLGFDSDDCKGFRMLLMVEACRRAFLSGFSPPRTLDGYTLVGTLKVPWKFR